MERRGVQFFLVANEGIYFRSQYDADLEWTLSSFSLTDPELEENYISVPGRLDGPIDASAMLTDGDPRYKSRKMTAVLETSSWDMNYRERIINGLIQKLSGFKWKIFPPQAEGMGRYLIGRVKVERLYNDLAHASVRITATCEPWLYSITEKTKEVTLSATTSQWAMQLDNAGSRTVTPTVEIAGGPLTLSGEGVYSYLGHNHKLPSTALTAGTYRLPDLSLYRGESFSLYASGTGTLKVTFREAVL